MTTHEHEECGCGACWECDDECICAPFAPYEDSESRLDIVLEVK